MDNSTVAADSTLAIMKSVRMIVPAAGLAVLWTWETLRPLMQSEQKERRHRHAIRNLSLTILNTIVMAMVFGFITVTIAAATQSEGWGLLSLTTWPPWMQVVAGVLMLDLWTWGWHHCNHRISLLWRFHRVHHSDDAMDVTTAARFHMGELAMSAIVKLPFIVLTGIDPITLLAHESILAAVSQFHHSLISIGSLDGLLKWLIVTPQMHRIHHSRLITETNSNYASILSIWDRLFGTYCGVLSQPGEPTGLDEWDADSWQTVSGMLKTPFIETSSKQPLSQES
jgi:sterol desaturase/sphingolipid hydroxylase (fatty acid hydroxylase superfamily)